MAERLWYKSSRPTRRFWRKPPTENCADSSPQNLFFSCRRQPPAPAQPSRLSIKSAPPCSWRETESPPDISGSQTSHIAKRHRRWSTMQPSSIRSRGEYSRFVWIKKRMQWCTEGNAGGGNHSGLWSGSLRKALSFEVCVHKKGTKED
ncbi:hypothetical protein NPIL_26911 [Nephila pilipes]|uniref:Uncharacterized protein n=1 Tax=Nephila pilipes TaxID=299642 RepID=A0A8X6UVZ9_NEPPI|nr:hypothetical protein NPIL_26911 [Nephila pilipes]